MCLYRVSNLVGFVYYIYFTGDNSSCFLSHITDNDGSYVTSSHHSQNHRLSPIPKIEQPQTLRSDVVDHGVQDEVEPTPR